MMVLKYHSKREDRSQGHCNDNYPFTVQLKLTSIKFNSGYGYYTIHVTKKLGDRA